MHRPRSLQSLPRQLLELLRTQRPTLSAKDLLCDRPVRRACIAKSSQSRRKRSRAGAVVPVGTLVRPKARDPLAVPHDDDLLPALDGIEEFREPGLGFCEGDDASNNAPSVL
jgi:hypothetical protein